MVAKIVVIGAGISGLAAGVLIQESRPDAQVTIYSDRVSPNVTTDVAAGYVQPYLVQGQDKEINRWMRVSFEYLWHLANSGDAHGAIRQSGYVLNETPQPTPSWSSVVKDFRVLSESETRDLNVGDEYKQAFFFTTVGLTTTVYLAYLQQRFLNAGGRFQRLRLASIEDLPATVELIVNCSGLGSRHLFGDQSIRPQRGQVVRVQCPAIKHFYNFGTNYVLLNTDCAVLGGTAQLDDWDETNRQEDIDRILRDNCRRLPQLKTARILSASAGLRPYRASVRCEREDVQFHGRKVPVLHNYGHGGSGITLFYGCALDVLDMAQQALGPHHSKSTTVAKL